MLENRKMVCAVNYASHGWNCVIGKIFIDEVIQTPSGLIQIGCKYVSDMSHSFCYGMYGKIIFNMHSVFLFTISYDKTISRTIPTSYHYTKK